eukprot:694465-Prorocentrum_lima.AAC.1
MAVKVCAIWRVRVPHVAVAAETSSGTRFLRLSVAVTVPTMRILARLPARCTAVASICDMDAEVSTDRMMVSVSPFLLATISA